MKIQDHIIGFVTIILFSGAISLWAFSKVEAPTLNKNLLHVPIGNQASVAVVDPKEEFLPPMTLLGRAEIGYVGSVEGRAKNIELGLAKLNGTKVLPGEEFSFIKALGPVTEEDGYTEQKVFLNDEVTLGIGGGLCQVSTALFQSALKAGLPVTERHNHTYSVIFYKEGLDATYSDPYVDLKFVNDTAYPIEIRSSAENQSAVFEIYGVADGRVATTTEAVISDLVDVAPHTRYVFVSERDPEKPQCVNTPQIGYTTDVTYSVLYSSGENKEQVFTSRYKPLQRVCFVKYGEIMPLP